jgi:hypothetical protein
MFSYPLANFIEGFCPDANKGEIAAVAADPATFEIVGGVPDDCEDRDA